MALPGIVDLDDDALAAASELLGTKTKKDAVNAALRETVARLRRARALAGLAELGARRRWRQDVQAV